jgi:hypothetical protein
LIGYIFPEEHRTQEFVTIDDVPRDLVFVCLVPVPGFVYSNLQNSHLMSADVIVVSPLIVTHKTYSTLFHKTTPPDKSTVNLFTITKPKSENTMKSPSNTPNTSDNNLTNPTTLSNSIRLAALSNSNVVDTPSVLPTSTRTITSSPESEAVQRERLRVFLDFAIAVIDSDDLDPIESSSKHQSPQQ